MRRITGQEDLYKRGSEGLEFHTENQKYVQVTGPFITPREIRAFLLCPIRPTSLCFSLFPLHVPSVFPFSYI